MAARKVPPDVARVLEVFRKLGSAARRALWLKEKQTKKEVQDAARAAGALAKRSRR